MQIKTTMRYYVIPIRISIIKKTTNNKCWRGYGEQRPQYTVGGNDIGAATMETVWTLLKKLKIDLPYDPAIPLLGIYMRKMKTLI